MSYRITYGQLGSEVDLYNPAGRVWLVSAKLPMELNVSPVLTIELPPNHPMLHKMEAMSTEREIRVYEDDEEIFRGRIITSQDDLDRLNVVEAESQQAYLNDIRVRPYTTYYTDDQKDNLPIISGNLAQYLIETYNAHCTAGREFSFQGSEVGDGLMVSQTSNPTVRDELNDKIYELGAWAEVTSSGQDRLIRFSSTPAEGDQTIELGKNLIEYAHKDDYTGIITAIIAKGKRSNESFGLDEIQDGVYGTIRITGDTAIHIQGEAAYGIIEDERTYEATTPSQLFELVERDLEASVVNVSSIDVKAHDLHLSDASIPPLRLGRSYTVKAVDAELKMQLTSMELNICDPSKSEYHFGKKAASLSRSEASSASKSRTQITQITQRQNSTNRKLIDGLDEIGDGLVDLEHLYSGFDERLDGMDEAVEIAKEAAKNTAYGVCNTGSSTRAKTVTVAYPQGGTFELKDGTVVSVRFVNANAAENPTLNVSGTGAHSIVTNGVNQAIWEAGQTVLLTYMGGNWCVMSAPVWTSSQIVGDPRDYHIELMPSEFSMCVGENKYINADPDGLQIGYTATVDSSNMAKGRRNIHIGSSTIAFRQGQTDYMLMDDTGVQVGMSDGKHMYTKVMSDSVVFHNPKGYGDLTIKASETNLSPAIVSDSGLDLETGYTADGEHKQSLIMSSDSGWTYMNARRLYFNADSFHFSANYGIFLNSQPLVMRSIVITGNGTEYVQIPKSDILINSFGQPANGDLWGYAFAVTNGDRDASDVFPIGYETDRYTLYVKFDRVVGSGIPVRLNIMGVPVIGVYPSSPTGSDDGQDGPEIFGDPAEPDGPSIESHSDEEDA